MDWNPRRKKSPVSGRNLKIYLARWIPLVIIGAFLMTLQFLPQHPFPWFDFSFNRNATGNELYWLGTESTVDSILQILILVILCMLVTISAFYHVFHNRIFPKTIIKPIEAMLNEYGYYQITFNGHVFAFAPRKGENIKYLKVITIFLLGSLISIRNFIRVHLSLDLPIETIQSIQRISRERGFQLKEGREDEKMGRSQLHIEATIPISRIHAKSLNLKLLLDEIRAL
ncbi:MAG: hypothetical protein ACFFCS_24425 [Candidatus Hodarchaeota archaeon]